MTSILPVMVIFNLDYTIWPFSTDLHVVYPCYPVDGEIVDDDGAGRVIKYYPEVPAIFEMLKTANIQIAVSFNKTDVLMANELIRLFDFDDYISFEAIYPEKKTTHLKNIRNKSKVPYDKMIFFDSDLSSVNDAEEMGIYSVFVDAQDGVTMKIVKDALKKYELREQQKMPKEPELKPSNIHNILQEHEKPTGESTKI